MISGIHLTGTTHCPERAFTTHNSTPHERKISTQNMTAKGTRNMIDNILVDIETLRYTIPPFKTKCTTLTSSLSPIKTKQKCPKNAKSPKTVTGKRAMAKTSKSVSS